MGTLYIVATPLGNLEDMTLRAVRTLKAVKLIASEDTRTTGKLLKQFEITCPLMSYHEHSRPDQLARILDALSDGDVALVSDAGTPLLSDPGYKLVQAAIAQDVNVVAIPGPSALLTALPVSGLPMTQFLFMGFVPRKGGQRQQFLAAVKQQPVTLVFYESPHRLLDTLMAMRELFGEARPIALCRELTKLHEEVWRGTLGEACHTWPTREIRGEFTLVVGGATETSTWDEGLVRAALKKSLADGSSTKDAVKQVTALSGWPKREVYALAQRM